MRLFKQLPIVLAIQALTCVTFAEVNADTGKVVGPGVTWRSEFLPEGPLNYNVMRIEIDNPLVTLETESGKDRLFTGEKVLDSVQREEEPGKTKIIGGVNADFWASSPRPYNPIGLLVADGMIYNMPAKRRSAFVFTADEKAYIGPVTLSVTLKSDDRELNIDRINSSTKSDNEIVLFTPPYGETVEAAKGKRYLLKMENSEFLPNQSVQVVISETESSLLTQLAARMLVLHVPEARVEDLSFLQSGHEMTLSANLPEVDGVVRSVCGGGPAIVQDGKVNIADEGMGASFSETKHPRTALGLSRDGTTVYLVTVDGRQPRISVGASLEELADYLVSIGAWQAINLDGGGSTSMVVNDKVVNKPSDFKGPRTVANSLLVVAEAGSGKPAELTFDPSGSPLTVPAGATVSFEIAALDDNSIPVTVGKDTELTVSSSPLISNARIDGKTVAVTFNTRPQTGELQFSLGEAEGSLSIDLVKLEKVETEPAVLVLGSGDTVPVYASAYSSGQKVALASDIAEIESNDPTIASVENGIARGVGKGAAELTVNIGAFAAKVPVYVDLAKGVTLEDFETVEDLTPIEGKQFNEELTKIELETENVKEGQASAKVKYAMSRGGRTRIHIPVDAKIDDTPAGFGIWVYGDGQEAWLRAYLTDKNNTLFIADFTNGADGITWKNEWKHITVPYQSLIGTDFNKSPRPVLPLKVDHLVIAQDQEALKRSGTILLDGFRALYPPPSQNK